MENNTFELTENTEWEPNYDRIESISDLISIIKALNITIFNADKSEQFDELINKQLLIKK